jgi:heme exporter protein C
MNQKTVVAAPAGNAGSWLHYYANPGRFLRLAKPALPWLAGFSIAITAIGLVWGYGFAPADWEQGASCMSMSQPPGWRWRAMRRWQSARFSR